MKTAYLLSTKPQCIIQIGDSGIQIAQTFLFKWKLAIKITILNLN